MSFSLTRRGVLMGSAVSFVAALLALTGAFVPGPVLAQPGSDHLACQELIVNGDFESGHTGWAEYSSQAYELIDPFYPHSPTHSAWLGANNNEEDWVSQSVALPANAASLTLHYWWSLYTEEHPGTQFDFLRVQLVRVDGTLITELKTYNNDSAEAWLWNDDSVDVSAYAGQTLQLRFLAKNDANDPTSFFVDDVSIQACNGGSTATPTLTATGTATATATPTATKTPGPSPTPTNTPRSRVYLPLLVR